MLESVGRAVGGGRVGNEQDGRNIRMLIHKLGRIVDFIVDDDKEILERPERQTY